MTVSSTGSVNFMGQWSSMFHLKSTSNVKKSWLSLILQPIKENKEHYGCPLINSFHNVKDSHSAFLNKGGQQISKNMLLHAFLRDFYQQVFLGFKVNTS